MEVVFGLSKMLERQCRRSMQKVQQSAEQRNTVPMSKGSGFILQFPL
jgi:hypothetical protein